MLLGCRTVYSVCLEYPMAAGAGAKIGMAVAAGAAAAGAYFIISGGISLALLRSAPAAFPGQSVAIDGLAYRPTSTVSAQLHRLSLEGSSLSPAEVVTLFSPGPLAGGAREAFGKLTAEKILTPEILVTVPGGTLTLRGLEISHVQAGMAAQLRIVGGDLTLKANGADVATFKIGALTLADIDVGYVFGALRNGNVKSDFLRYGTLLWDGMTGTLTVPHPQGAEQTAIELGEVQVANVYEAGLPKRSAVAFAGIRFTPGSGLLTSTLASIGLETIDVTGKIAVSYDWPQRKVTVEEVTLAVAGLATFSLKGSFGNADKAILVPDQDARNAANLGMTLESGSLKFTNTGLIDKLVELGAKLGGRPAEAVKTEALAAFSRLLLGGKGRLEDGPAMAAFIKDPRSLTLSIKPKAGVAQVSFDKMNGQLRDIGRFEMEIRSND